LLDEYKKTGLTLGEYPTITALHEHCKAEVSAGRQSIVFYMHLKSAQMQILGDTVASRATATPFWREAMNTLNLEFSSICLRALLAGSSVCGSLFRHAPTSHFAGNFFWASCNHVAQLAPLPSPVTDFEAAEFFLMRTNNNTEKTPLFAGSCAYEVFATAKNLRYYKQPIWPKEYMNKIEDLLTERDLPKCELYNRSVEYYGEKVIKHGFFDNKPCLSALTPPDASLSNYYDVSFSNIETFRWEKPKPKNQKKKPKL
jgi:hypothetical protein